ncbi:hypothetical protein E2C01_069583 [Portunus trituberculatus]|uniref:Uncharacterized protein n=1 Tax=Portunus trituberculatus TaxID=210409 RepID=A0A5B7HZY3_PORTR|nr:hypothetical protein [Portunus trituberculatus]
MQVTTIRHESLQVTATQQEGRRHSAGVGQQTVCQGVQRGYPDSPTPSCPTSVNMVSLPRSTFYGLFLIFGRKSEKFPQSSDLK